MRLLTFIAMRKKALVRQANKMRQRLTPSEAIFAKKLSAWGFRYKMQKVVGPWIADFYLPEYELIVEIDGKSHFTRTGRLRDQLRDRWFEKNNYRILHIRNEDVDTFQCEDLFGRGKNGPVHEEEGLPAYLTEVLDTFS